MNFKLMHYRGAPVPPAMRNELVTLFKMAAENAFGWAKIRRSGHTTPEGEALSKEEAERWLNAYTGGIATTEWLAQKPGLPTHLIGLAFRDMTISAEEFEKWGYRLTAAHDRLCAAE